MGWGEGGEGGGRDGGDSHRCVGKGVSKWLEGPCEPIVTCQSCDIIVAADSKQLTTKSHEAAEKV